MTPCPSASTACRPLHRTGASSEIAIGSEADAAAGVARRTRAQQPLQGISIEELELLDFGSEDAAAQADAEYEAFIWVGQCWSM